MTYRLPTSNYLQRGLAMNQSRWQQYQSVKSVESHSKRVRRELRQAGAYRFELGSMEGRYIPKLIKADEHVMAMVYGHHEDGMVMIVATDRRVVFLDKKPLFTNDDEISYGMVGGVTVSHAGIGTTFELHTRIRDYKIVTFNLPAAQTFADFIEKRCLEFTERLKGFQDITP